MRRILFFLCLIVQHPVLFGQNWVPLDKGIECFFTGDVRRIYIDSIQDQLYVTGAFNQDGDCVTMRGVARWNGSAWDSMSNANNGAANKFAITKFNDTLLLYGNFYTANIFRLAKWDGSSWDTITSSPNFQVLCYAEKNGELYLGGAFDELGSDSTFLLGKYDGQQFSGLTPYEGPNSALGYIMTCMAFYHDTLYVGGDFSVTSNGFAADFAKYQNGILDTVNGQFVGTGAASYIETMVVYRDELYIGGYFRQQDGFTGDYIMKWDGQQFSEVGGGVNDRVTTMKVYGDRLYVGGYFTQSGDSATNYLAVWDGVVWQTFNDTFSANSIIRDLGFYRDSLIISGHFKTINGDTVNHIAKYNHALPLSIMTPNATIGQVVVFPVPASESVNFQFPNLNVEKNLKVYDQFGREIWHGATDESIITLSVIGFSAGMYYYSVFEEGGDSLQGKFIVSD